MENNETVPESVNFYETLSDTHGITTFDFQFQILNVKRYFPAFSKQSHGIKEL